jgi:thioredoxin reductase (NADPH)
MGLIRNAITQGVQAVDAIAAATAKEEPAPDADMLDLLIVGSGPAGIAASLGAMQHGLSFETIEQDSLGGTVAHYPRHKLVMTEPAALPLYGEIKARRSRRRRCSASGPTSSRKPACASAARSG